VLTIERWLNVDDCEPMPGWMNDVAAWLTGGRFAIETAEGTVIAEMGDTICYDDGRAWVEKPRSRKETP
jgi:hypothetical protein